MTDEVSRGVRLTPQAEADLETIWRYGAATWSPEQADRYLDGLVAVFDLLCTMPGLARECVEFTPPVRVHPTGPHLVIYRVSDQHLDVLRILGSRQNWHAILEALE